MKKKIIITLFAIVVFSVNTLHAQLRTIPAEVTNGFTEKYPDATNVVWQDQLVDYKVSFDENGNTYKAKFSNKGEWKITERQIALEFLPKSVNKGFSKSEYADWEIMDLSIVKTPESDRQYKLTVAKNKINKRDLLFNEDGYLVKDNFTF